MCSFTSPCIIYMYDLNWIRLRWSLFCKLFINKVMYELGWWSVRNFINLIMTFLLEQHSSAFINPYSSKCTWFQWNLQYHIVSTHEKTPPKQTDFLFIGFVSLLKKKYSYKSGPRTLSESTCRLCLNGLDTKWIPLWSCNTSWHIKADFTAISSSPPYLLVFSGVMNSNRWTKVP